MLLILGLGMPACAIPAPDSRDVPSGETHSATPGQAAPTTRDISQAALEVAVSDRRLADLLDANSYDLESVRPAGQNHDVYIVFDDPIARSAWPLDACELFPASEPITGVQWRLDVRGQNILAVSPVWGDASCISN